MSTDKLASKIKELRSMRDYARSRMIVYAPGSLVRATFEGRVSAFDDMIRTFEDDLPPFELKHFRRPNGEE